MASLPPARAMAICPNTVDAWLDCNAAGEFPAFVAIGGPFSNAKPRFAPPRLLRKIEMPELILPRTLPFILS